MSATSWRHHYLPVFYLKGFTKGSGKFKIYNVQLKRFLDYGKEFSTRSYFFEKDANTLTKDGIKYDFLETHYQEFEDKIAKLLTTINLFDSNTRFGLNESDMPILQFFISLMYWRLPHKQEEIDIILHKNDFFDLGLKIVDKEGVRDYELEEKMKYDVEFKKAFRFFNAMADSARGINCNTPLTILSIHENFPSICSDNPVLFEKGKGPQVSIDNFIFPISESKLLIRGDKTNNFKPYLKLWVDILIYKQAVKYVCCSDERYISMLEDYYNKHFSSVEHLRQELFKLIK